MSTVLDITVHQYSEHTRANVLLLPKPIRMKQHQRLFGDVCHKTAMKLLAGFRYVAGLSGEIYKSYFI